MSPGGIVVRSVAVGEAASWFMVMAKNPQKHGENGRRTAFGRSGSVPGGTLRVPVKKIFTFILVSTVHKCSLYLLSSLSND